jgi:cysteine desulfurase/selenocysteine lyase
MLDGDAIVLSILEHHSNIVPWMHLARQKNLDIRWIGIDEKGGLKMDDLDAHLADGKVKMVAVTGLSNVLGTKPDLCAIIEKSHAAGALVLVDATQLAVHDVIDVQEIDCDFLVCSGHKLYGPTGIGALYGKKKHLGRMAPLVHGSMMIGEVTKEGFSLADVPMRFEAGTQPVAEAVGFAAAIDWLAQFPMEDRKTHERALLQKAIDVLSAIDGVTILGPASADAISGCISFTTDGIHPHDLTDLLGEQGFCLRAGHHCAQPLHKYLDIPASTRLSVGIYNTVEDIEALGPAIEKILSRFR